MHARALGALAGACLLALPAAANADFPHVVSRGETLASVAAQDGLTVAALAAANGLSPNATLIAGRILQIPPRGVLEKRSTSSTGTASTSSERAGGTGSASAGGTYVVRSGDTLSAIAARAGTTVGELAALNGIRRRNLVFAGMKLTLPGGASRAGGGTTELVSTTTGGDGTGGGSYVVRPGDTLSAIAARAGTTVDELAALNGITRRNLLIAGTRLTLPGGSTGAGTEMTSTTTGTSSASSVPTTTGSGGPPYPTNQVVTASEIASIANAEGVPPALAEAIAWQESGFNNSEVSNVGAVGVMQIVPDTWRWIGDHVATIPLQPASASDNVRAGVLLLHALLAETGSYSETAAGYYQGLASISRNGTYSSTRRYVASVLALMSRFGG
jgi:LysM repeat protein